MEIFYEEICFLSDQMDPDLFCGICSDLWSGKADANQSGRPLSDPHESAADRRKPGDRPKKHGTGSAPSDPVCDLDL